MVPGSRLATAGTARPTRLPARRCVGLSVLARDGLRTRSLRRKRDTRAAGARSERRPYRAVQVGVREWLSSTWCVTSHLCVDWGRTAPGWKLSLSPPGPTWERSCARRGEDGMPQEAQVAPPPGRLYDVLCEMFPNHPLSDGDLGEGWTDRSSSTPPGGASSMSRVMFTLRRRASAKALSTAASDLRPPRSTTTTRALDGPGTSASRNRTTATGPLVRRRTFRAVLTLDRMFGEWPTTTNDFLGAAWSRASAGVPGTMAVSTLT